MSENSHNLVNQYIAAGDPRISEGCVEKLSHSQDPLIRRRIAENPSTPLPILFALLNDEHSEVRLGVSFNPLVQRPFLDELVHDRNVDVRYGLAENPTLPLDLIEELIKDENPYVAQRAKNTYNRLASISWAA
ncbi:hypothetical protein BH11CYA1_BH11CYA1_01030 [soil metagenome]